MNKTAWMVVGIIEVVIMLAIAIWSGVMGGCSTQLETTAGGTCFMKCHWTFIAMPFVAIIGVVTAALATFAKTAEGRRFCAVATVVVAIIAIILTTSLGIGICAKSEMHCNTTAMGVWIMGAIAIILGLVQIAKGNPEAAERPKMKL